MTHFDPLLSIHSWSILDLFMVNVGSFMSALKDIWTFQSMSMRLFDFFSHEKVNFKSLCTNIFTFGTYFRVKLPEILRHKIACVGILVKDDFF